MVAGRNRSKTLAGTVIKLTYSVGDFYISRQAGDATDEGLTNSSTNTKCMIAGGERIKSFGTDATVLDSDVRNDDDDDNGRLRHQGHDLEYVVAGGD